ncbi:hypothetical protein QF028_006069 [Neobacillus sp. B4I6]
MEQLIPIISQMGFPVDYTNRPHGHSYLIYNSGI